MQHFDERFGKNPSENYERFFVPVIGKPMAVDLVERADLQPGERVLDVACGTGIVARLAAEKIGAKGAVTGLDANPGMLQVAKAAMTPDVPARWEEADAHKMPFEDGSFDAVLCQLSFQFMEDKPAALREMHRVLVEGGRAALNVPGPIVPMFAAFGGALGRHIGPEVNGFVQAVFSLHDVDLIRGLMDGAGFRDVVVEGKMKTLTLPPPRDFLWQYIHSTPLSGMVAQADAETREALTRDVVTQWKEYEEDGSLRYDQRVVEFTGKK